MSRSTLLLGGLVAALSLGLAIVLFNAFGDGGTRATVRSFEVLSDTAIRVDFEVVKAAGDTVVCTVRARDASGSETGFALVRVGPADDDTVLVSHELPTRNRANTGELIGCDAVPAD